jgi:hypothetical protein
VPRTTTNSQFIIQRLRFAARDRKATPAQRLEAIKMLAVIEGMLKTKEVEPTKVEPPVVDSHVQETLNRIRGEKSNANKLPESSS